MAVLPNMFSVFGSRYTLAKLLRTSGPASRGKVPAGRMLATSMVNSGAITSRLRTSSEPSGAARRMLVRLAQAAARRRGSGSVIEVVATAPDMLATGLVGEEHLLAR